MTCLKNVRDAIQYDDHPAYFVTIPSNNVLPLATELGVKPWKLDRVCVEVPEGVFRLHVSSYHTEIQVEPATPKDRSDWQSLSRAREKRVRRANRKP